MYYFCNALLPTLTDTCLRVGYSAATLWWQPNMNDKGIQFK